MSDYNVKPITKQEMLDRFEVSQYRYEVTSYKRVFKLSDTNSGNEYSGVLYWDADDGFITFWDGLAPAEYLEYDDFDYTVDAILGEGDE